MPAVDASGNRIARTLDGGPRGGRLHPLARPSPGADAAGPEPTPLPTERELPRQVSRRKIALSPPASPTKASGPGPCDAEEASFGVYELHVEAGRRRSEGLGADDGRGPRPQKRHRPGARTTRTTF